MEITSLLSLPNTAFLGMTIIAISIGIVIINGMALWKAARLKDTAWFWVILLVNSVGVIPLIYLYLKRNKTV